MIKGKALAARLRAFADKLDAYENAFGYKTGWDGGLHPFMSAFANAEKVLDANIKKAAKLRSGQRKEILTDASAHVKIPGSI